MINKKFTLLIIGAILISGILLSNVLSSRKQPIKRKSANRPAEKVKVLTVENQDIRKKFEISGYLSALDKADIYAEVSGLLLRTPKRFREGTRFARGEVMIKIDDAVYRNNVLAQKSNLLNQLTLLMPDLTIDFPDKAAQWNAYLEKFDLTKNLDPLPEADSAKEKYYIASRNIYNQYYTIKGMEETLAKYTISAPYNGVVSESNINPGTLARIGQKLGEFTNTDVYELEAFAGVDDIRHLKPGHSVNLSSNEIEGEFKGIVKRINPVIDRQSQTVKIYITARDKRLKDGMYCTAHIISEPILNVFMVPRNLIIGNGHLYVIQDSTLVLRAVDIVNEENDHVAIRGLENAEQILGMSISDAYDGMKLNGASAN